ncbi:MAG: response regulator [Magnetococcales bacterium]|nr:response regulator [Magnetococcales bacterium]
MNDAEENKPRILIVDDIVVNLKLLRQILRDDFLISFAPGGVRALEVVALQKPDLILLDIMMPDMDGISVCRHLRENPETAAIPVIFISANEEAMADIAACGGGGPVDCIVKPVNAGVLLTKIKQFLG